jgi:RNA polymerase sigma factor (sigma-70 family)
MSATQARKSPDRQGPPNGIASCWRRAQTGDKSAEPFVFAACRDRLQRWLQSTLNPQDFDLFSEDIIQECLERFRKSDGLFQYDGQLFSWLRKAMRSVVADFGKNQRKAQFARRILAHRPQQTQLADRHLEWRLASLEHCFGLLNPEDQSLLLVYYSGDVPSKIHADCLGLKKGVYHVRLCRARARLKRLILEHESE